MKLETKIIKLLQQFSCAVEDLYMDNKTIQDERKLEKEYANKIIKVVTSK